MNTQPAFYLKKWYLDCIGSDGAARIWYCVLLKYRGITLHYNNALLLLPGQPVQSRTSFRRRPEPLADGNIVVWKPPFLRENAVFSTHFPAVEQELFASSEGVVRWRCLAPAATVSHSAFSGKGYVEQMEMTIPPWRLPIDVLRWGRAHCDGQAAVWIDWQGEISQRCVWINGCEDSACTVADNNICWGDGKTLALTPEQVIRQGRVVSTVLRKIPLLSGLLPPELAAMHEAKFLGHAMLTNGSTSYGKAIYETVRFR